MFAQGYPQRATSMRTESFGPDSGRLPTCAREFAGQHTVAISANASIHVESDRGRATATMVAGAFAYTPRRDTPRVLTAIGLEHAVGHLVNACRASNTA